MNLKNSAQGKFSNWPNASPLAAYRLRTLGPQQTERGTGGAEVRVLQVPPGGRTTRGRATQPQTPTSPSVQTSRSPARFSSALCLAPRPRGVFKGTAQNYLHCTNGLLQAALQVPSRPGQPCCAQCSEKVSSAHKGSRKLGNQNFDFGASLATACQSHQVVTASKLSA